MLHGRANNFFQHLPHLLIGAVAAAALTACGGGGGGEADSPSSQESKAAVARNFSAQAETAAASAALPSWPATPEFVYHDEAPFLALSPRQLEVSSKGDAFLTWHATHKTAEGVVSGTDVNVIQHAAGSDTWRRATIANVPFPEAGGGFVYNQKTLALPQGDMVVLWDVVDIPPYDPNTFNKPPQVYASRYSAAQNRWSPPRLIPGDYAIYSFANGWEVLPAGEGRLLMLWQTRSGGFYARFYSASDDSWSEPQDIGALAKPADLPRTNWQVYASFNRSGTGVVQVGGTRPTTLYVDGMREAWSVITAAPRPEGFYYFGSVVEKPFAVDEEGNVFSALFDQSYGLRLSKWSAKTRQVERTQVVQQFSSIASGISLNLGAEGGLLTWASNDDLSTNGDNLHFVTLSRDGLLKESPQAGPRLSGPAEVTPWISYANNLQTRTTQAGQAYALWSRIQCRFEAGCSTVDFQFSTYQPGQGWSATQTIPSQVQLMTGEGIPFKVNAAGAAALAMPDLVIQGVPPDTRRRIDVRVMALNVKPD